MKYIKVVFVSIAKMFKELRLPAKILLAIILMAVLTVGSVVIVTDQTPFCNSCHIMNPYYASWQKSSHSNVNCLLCHLKPGLSGFVRGKLNGLAQLVDCVVGRVGTKPNASVKDVSCLRAECHNAEKLVSKDINYKTVKFTHKKHVGKEVDGVTISCTTCHNHFAGDKHFNINSEVCFTCHFLKSSESGSRLVHTVCRDCHEVPTKVIERGFVKTNHAEFVSYKANCDLSCHKREIEKVSNVSDDVCLNCHDFRKGQARGAELHHMHTNNEKVACFSCHGEILHGQRKTLSFSAMMDCKSCHSDTHSAQLSTYTAEQHPENKSDNILSPMFLTHVECTSCHIEQVPIKFEGISTIGKVAKAVPRACDQCHEPGTGQKYIPFWQKNIRKLCEEVGGKLTQLEKRAQTETDEKTAEKLKEEIRRAKSLIDSVKADGSWGVHNLKYTEAMLLKANEIITGTQ